MKSLEDLADLAGDELAELAPDARLSADEAGAIIMDARVRLGWIEAPAEDDAADDGQNEAREEA